MNRLLLLWVTALFTILLAVGCIDYEQTISINDDLSGTVEFNIAMSPYLGDNMDEDGSMSDAPTNFLVEDYSKIPGCKIEDDSYSYDEETELENYSVKFKLDNLNNLNGYGSYENDKTVSITEENGIITYRENIIVQREDVPPDTSAEGEISEDEQMMREMMEGYTFIYRVVMPKDVTETNGDIGEDGRTVSWVWPTSEFIKLQKIEVFAECAR